MRFHRSRFDSRPPVYPWWCSVSMTRETKPPERDDGLKGTGPSADRVSKVSEGRKT